MRTVFYIFLKSLRLYLFQYRTMKQKSIEKNKTIDAFSDHCLQNHFLCMHIYLLVYFSVYFVPHPHRNHFFQQFRDFVQGCMCNIDSFDSTPVTEQSLGEFKLQCSFCDAYGFKSEIQGNLDRNSQNFDILCCSNGKLDLPRIPTLPGAMDCLFDGSTKNSKYFLKNNRKFNHQITSPPSVFKYTFMIPTHKQVFEHHISTKKIILQGIT